MVRDCNGEEKALDVIAVETCHLTLLSPRHRCVCPGHGKVRLPGVIRV